MRGVSTDAAARSELPKEVPYVSRVQILAKGPILSHACWGHQSENQSSEKDTPARELPGDGPELIQSVTLKRKRPRAGRDGGAQVPRPGVTSANIGHATNFRHRPC